MTFRQAYCARCGIPAEHFEAAVLRECLFPHAQPLVRLARKRAPGPFEPDLDLIRAVADCSSLREMGAELSSHRYHVPVAGLWRRLLRLRVSGRRLLALGALLLEEKAYSRP